MNSQQHHQCHYVGIQKSFEKACVSYDNEAVVQFQTGALLINYLTVCKSYHQKVLDLGCGTGLTTLHLCKRLFISSLHINDFSPLLLKKTRDHLRLIQAKPLLFNFDHSWDCNDSYDLIFSNMAFQWSFAIEELLKNCFNHLNQNGILAFSLPLKGSFVEFSPHQCITFHDFDYLCEILDKIGFSIIKADLFLRRQTFNTHLQALKSIKKCGANYTPHPRSYKLIDRSKLTLPSTLTYKIGIFIARKTSAS
ncbi:MAG: methyltransferase domain-containing protein [Alphaproteobacteria bacterium]|nr:methyltransferase domain-containing protein [Alphaproteobacteria bacterium]